MNKIYLAHRGYREKYKENTLEAFEKSLNKFDGVELDLRISKDNHLVLFHDPHIESKKISDLTLKELKELKVDSFIEFLNKFHNKFSYINIDLKEKELKTVKILLDLLSNYENKTKFIISSYYPKILNEIKKINKKTQTALLIKDESQINNIKKLDSFDWISVLDKISKNKIFKKYNLMIWSEEEIVCCENGKIIIQDTFQKIKVKTNFCNVKDFSYNENTKTLVVNYKILGEKTYENIEKDSFELACSVNSKNKPLGKTIRKITK